MLEQLRPVTHNRIINIIVLILLSFPFLYSITSFVACDRTGASRFYVYGYDLDSPILEASVILIKKCLHFLVNSTFPSLVAVLFCYLCLRCSSCYNCLTEKVFLYSPEEFEHSEQIHILRKKEKRDDILENLQDIFSIPSFFLDSIAFINMLLVLRISMTRNVMKCVEAKAVFYGIPNLVSLIVILWIAGDLPTEQNKLKGTFYKRAHSKYLIVFPS
ncbi:uncharacterized protein TNIN_3011 [Trichonephila inaurata madagascariensis]|uniref:Uncharacterized protein n=1 Tax=Trichonephila inaurata madagascariensis TaxID=2747483 RepID=A0A8X7BRJ2_9ARAC|nr:uncharacterized protein TNIN_3011 [Trichonephila inaurata madagascariensis]